MTQFQVDILMPQVMERITINCQGAPPFTFPGAFWFSAWMGAHEDIYNPNTGTYEFNQWVIKPSGNATIASKTYNQTTTGMGDVQENTRLELVHTPKL